MVEKEVKFESSTLEKYILIALVKDKSFFLKMNIFLRTFSWDKKSYFNDNKLQWILNACSLYYENNNKMPSFETLNIVIEKSFKTNPLLENALKTLLKNIFETKLEDIDISYIQEETIKFIRTKRAVEATYKNAADIESGNLEGLAERLQEAINVNFDKDLGLSLADTEAALSILNEEERNTGLTFGSNNLDGILGCPREGELTVFCGTPGVGKTIWLGNICVNNFMNKKKGVLFSLEVDKKRLTNRLYKAILGKSSLENLNKDEVKKFFKNFEPGDIIIKNYPANSASCNDFDAFITDLQATTGFVPDYIVIDYILITSTNNKRGDSEQSYKYYKTVSEEMRNLGIKWNCPVFTAAQLNREAQAENGGTKKVVSSKALSESRGILDTADYCLIINQTDDEKKLAEKDGVAEQRLLIAKNRNGDSGSMLNFHLDYKTMTIQDGKKLR